MTFREATIDDIPGMQRVRQCVQENKLSDPSLVKDNDYVAYLTTKGKGWLCEADGQIVGFAIADLQEHNIWALFVDPAYEQKGIGKRLHDTMLNWYFAKTPVTVWLGTAPDTKAERFYHNRGWTVVGNHGKEIKFEMTHEDWMQTPDYTE